jgi:NAD-dependent deacetylase
LPLHKYKRIVILTGAGISVASGLRSYRGPDGLWDDPQIQRFSHRDTLSQDPTGVWRFFGALRRQLPHTQPNPAHIALAQAAQALAPEQKMTLITQNIDALHEKAGSPHLIHYHGRVDHTACNNPRCSLTPYPDLQTYDDAPPKCPQCGSLLRPAVVLFGEFIDTEIERLAKRALRNCDLFLAIGTSGVVMPAASFVRAAKYVGARTLFVNLEPMEDPNPYFDESILGRAEEIVPALFSSSH